MPTENSMLNDLNEICHLYDEFDIEYILDSTDVYLSSYRLAAVEVSRNPNLSEITRAQFLELIAAIDEFKNDKNQNLALKATAYTLILHKFIIMIDLLPLKKNRLSWLGSTLLDNLVESLKGLSQQDKTKIFEPAFSKIKKLFSINQPYPYKERLLDLLVLALNESKSIDLVNRREELRSNFTFWKWGYYRASTDPSRFLQKFEVVLYLIDKVKDDKVDFETCTAILTKYYTFINERESTSPFDLKLRELLFSIENDLYRLREQQSAAYSPDSAIAPKILNYIWTGGVLPLTYLNDLLLSYGRLQAAGPRGVLKFWTTRPETFYRSVELSGLAIPHKNIVLLESIDEYSSSPVQIINLSNPVIKKQFFELAKKMFQEGLAFIQANASAEEFLPYEAIRINDVEKYILMELIGGNNYAAWSDMVRLIALFINGGMYLDTDCILGGPLENIRVSNNGFSYVGIRIDEYQRRLDEQAMGRLEASLEKSQIKVDNNCVLASLPKKPSLSILLTEFIKNYHDLSKNSDQKPNKLDQKRMDIPNQQRKDLTLCSTGPDAINNILKKRIIVATPYLPTYKNNLTKDNPRISCGPQDNTLKNSREIKNTVNIRCDNTWFVTDRQDQSKDVPKYKKIRRSNSM